MLPNTPVWHCGHYRLSLEMPLIMAIINVTPDSFSGDGLSGSVQAAMEQAERAIQEGAKILDVGGESSRPGAESVSVKEELSRVIPVVEALSRLGVPVSVDTVKPEVMKAAIAAGASIINDINALRSPGALEVLADSEAGICLMHMQGEPRTMQEAPTYTDVLGEVDGFLCHQLARVASAGIARERVCLDPGFGFGKALSHNLELFRGISHLKKYGLPLLVGVSRKRMLGDLTGRDITERMPAGIAAAVLAAQRGASILRVHDVAATRDALAVWSAIDHDRTGVY